MIGFIEARQGIRLAIRNDRPRSSLAGIMWLNGFCSDMAGTKATALAAYARSASRPFLRFDYSGHGASQGDFTRLMLSDWLHESRRIFETKTRGPRIIAGSSMGGYLALLLYRVLQREHSPALDRIKGLVLVAPAADMTEVLLWAKLDDRQRRILLDRGQLRMPSQYGGDTLITRALIEDGRSHLLLGEGLDVACPVRILQGEDDPDVPPAHAMEVFRTLRGEDVCITFIKGGEHRLSRPADVVMLTETVEALCRRAAL